MDYFRENDPFKWSLVSFLKWRAYNIVLKDCAQEHGAFKSLLKNIVNNDKDNIRTQKAKELLDNWQEIKCSPEVRMFWNDLKTQNLHQDIEYAKTRNELKLFQIESEDDSDLSEDQSKSSAESQLITIFVIIYSSTLDRNDEELVNKSIVQDDGSQTPPHQIVSNTYNPAISINENILRMSAESLASLEEPKFFNEFIPHFLKYKELEKDNAFSCTNDDVMDIRGDSGFSKFLSMNEYIKLLSKKPKRNVKLPDHWCNIIEEYYKETTERGSRKNISDWIRITKELNVLKKEDTENIIKLKEYLYRAMLPLIESFTKPIPDINASNSSEHHYWSEFGHRFFSNALQNFVNLDWRAMEVPVQASKYRKNYGYNHAIDKVVDGKYADLLAWMWKTGEEIFIGEQAGPPTQPDLTKLATDSFKLYREMRDCLNSRILRAMGKGDINYNNRAVFGALGYLFEIKMLIMWKDGVYVYEEYGSLNIASNSDQISMMKADMLKLLEFMMIIKTEMENTMTTEYNSDSVQILKRKFNEIIQTKPSPSKPSSSAWLGVPASSRSVSPSQWWSQIL
ncbi:6156_t:CDS:10 [Ambispora leptoticha]|uniref:6156_t:CDS:1 n=1 Tax=Ambispora leptoticha TaxID=144679 RepID=A0A9N9CAB1_9GLOM|nr:6156_t:CDS:10 [Ambispora leptoticha]